MRIDEKVQQIVESIPGLSYEYSESDWEHVTLDSSVELPVCLYLYHLPESGELINRNGNFRDFPNALIAFLDNTELIDNAPTIERMKDYARQFIIAVNNSELFDLLPENIIYQAVYDKLNVNLTGIMLHVQLRERQGICVK